MADGNMIPLLPQSDGRLAWGNGVISMLFDVTGIPRSGLPMSPVEAWPPQKGAYRGLMRW